MVEVYKEQKISRKINIMYEKFMNSSFFICTDKTISENSKGFEILW